MKPKDQYAVIAPVTKTGKYIIVARRIGTRERLAPIAEVRSENVADQIVEGLHLRQGELTKLDAKLAPQIEQLKADVQAARVKYVSLSTELGDARRRVSLVESDRDRIARDRDRLQVSVEHLNKDIAALQAKLVAARQEGAHV